MPVLLTRPKLKNDHKGHFLILGRVMGLEPTAFGTTTRRSNQLSYTRRIFKITMILYLLLPRNTMTQNRQVYRLCL